MPPFMSTAPRPYSVSPATSPPNGGCCHAFSSPGGTTSVWPANIRCGEAAPTRAYRFSTSSAPGSLKVMRCTVKPAAFKVLSRNLSAPPSAGVTERQRSRSRAMAMGSAVMCAPPLIPQQLVDAGLGARALVDALDDDRAIKTRTEVAAGHRIARHRSRDNHRVGRYFAVMNLAGRTIDDLGRHPEIDAHAEHRAFAHDDAFDHFGTRTNETVVLNHDRSGLQRLQHATDADAARQVAVLADLRA